jgi:hypothetical protein
MRPSFLEIVKFFSHVEGKLFFASSGGFWTLDREQEEERERRRLVSTYQSDFTFDM